MTIESIIKSNLIPKMMVARLGLDPNLQIYFRKSTENRQGSVEHIIADHRREIDQQYILAMKNAILNPIDIIRMKKNRLALVSLYSKDKQDRNVFFYVIIEAGIYGFEIITAYPTRKYNKHNKKDDAPREPI